MRFAVAALSAADKLEGMKQNSKAVMGGGNAPRVKWAEYECEICGHGVLTGDYQVPSKRQTDHVCKFVAKAFAGKHIYDVIVIVSGYPDFKTTLRADRKGQATTRAMIVYPYYLAGQEVSYKVEEVA